MEEYTHTWVNATCTDPKTCSACGATEGTDLGHDPEIRNAKEATKTEPGYTGDKVCKRCALILEKGKEIPATGEDVDIPVAPTPVYRMYNPYTLENSFVGEVERVALAAAGWIDQGIAWYVADSGFKVYRMYNPYADFHIYTMNEAEIATMESYGWKLDGVASCSAGESGVPIWRLFNPNVKAEDNTCYHYYTTKQSEIDEKVSQGWDLEGIAWYAAG